MTNPGRVAIIGVGNEFRRDDGVAYAVMTKLEERAKHTPLPPGTTIAACDGDPGKLVDMWNGVDLAIVVDAAHAHPGTPGKVHRLEMAKDKLWYSGNTSSHGLGLGESVELSRVLGRLPQHMIIYAGEGQDISMGPGLSPDVAAVVDPLVEKVEQEIARFRGASPKDGPRDGM